MVKVGDRLFAVEQIRRIERGRWIIVTKVGRKWAEFKNEGDWGATGRFAIDDMMIDGGRYSPIGRVYVSDEAWRENTRLQALWTELRRKIDRAYTIPPGATQIGILKAADALGIKLESE